jgi:hypothetical protein
LLKCGTWVSEISLASWEIKEARECKKIEIETQKGCALFFKNVQVYFNTAYKLLKALRQYLQ